MNNVKAYIIVNIKELDDKRFFTVARAINETNCVELHFNQNKAIVEYGTKISDTKWNNEIEDADWFSKNMTDEELIDKLLLLFNERFLEKEVSI